jgi:hypothetical protein
LTRIEVTASRAVDAMPREIREMIAEAERRCVAAEHPVLRFETVRSLARSQFLFGKARTVAQCEAAGVPTQYAWPTCPDGIVTKAPNNRSSWHGALCAIDWIHPTLRWGAPAKWWKDTADLIRPCGFTWGGAWLTMPDVPHYQHAALPSGPRLADKQDIANNNLPALWRRYLIAE